MSVKTFRQTENVLIQFDLGCDDVFGATMGPAMPKLLIALPQIGCQVTWP